MLPSTEGTRLALVTRGLVDKPVGGTHPSLRSKEGCVSVSALFDSAIVDLGGELQHISVPLLRVLVQLDLFQEVYD